MNKHDIIERFALPRELVSCPDCGRVYGHHKTTVCERCECCSKCCECGDKKKLVTPEAFVSSNT